jgi:hypothetical protein
MQSMSSNPCHRNLNNYYLHMWLAKCKIVLFCSRFQHAVEVLDVTVSVRIISKIECNWGLIYEPAAACKTMSRSSPTIAGVTSRVFGNNSQCVLIISQNSATFRLGSKISTLTSTETRSRTLPNESADSKAHTCYKNGLRRWDNDTTAPISSHIPSASNSSNQNKHREAWWTK